MLAVADGRGVRYPAWQFRDGSPVAGLAELVRAARTPGVDDASLVSWIEADDDRLQAVTSGEAASLIDRVADARRARTPVTRRRVAGRSPRLSDAAAG